MDDTDDDPMRYDYWIEEALRSVIARALRFAAEHGLSDDHHFYISFRTDTQDVVMPDYLRAQHPGEMTIVLQHQYDELAVGDQGFAVTLKFGGKPERLHVPFAEVTGFTDPSVNFGLQLSASEYDLDDEDGEIAFEEMEDSASSDNEPVQGDFGQTSPVHAKAEDEGDDEDSSPSGEVIALDAFRKK